MNLTVILFFIGGLLTGLIGAWFVLFYRYSAQKQELEARLRSTEAIDNELRKQLDQKDSEIAELRDKLSVETQEKTKTLTELEASLKNLEEQKAMIETMKKEMADTFKALSSAALKSSSEDFLKLASEHLGRIVAETKGKLGEHKEAMDGLLKPLQEALKRYEEEIKEMEMKRRQDYGSLQEHLKNLSQVSQQLQQETNSLVTALRKPQVSGSWGQLSLRRAAELAGMTAYCDFYEEVSVTTESGRLRPDMIIRLPNGREIVVDAKAPVDAYLKAISETSEEERQKSLSHYVSQVRSHMNTLGSKSYWDQFPKSPEMVIMYLPGESFFSAAIEYDHKLIEDSSLRKVILATPTTFIALLKAIAYGWQQVQLTENAVKISNLGREVYERFGSLARHFSELGSALGKAINTYNRAVGSMEARLLPSIRRLREMGIKGAAEISELQQIDRSPRDMTLIDIESENNGSSSKE